MRTGQATLSRQHQRDLERIQKFEHQLQAYRLNVQKAQDKIRRLTAEIRQTMQDVSNLDPSQSPDERIYLDIVKTMDLSQRTSVFHRYPHMGPGDSCCFSCGP
jgi:chromosome segregation ATPase